jgi:hypothetical protein
LLALELIRRQAVLAGRVTDAATGAPLAGAVVSVKGGPAAWTAWLAARAVGYGDRWDRLPVRPDRQITAADGSFRFLAPMPAGAYTLSASLPAAGDRYAAAERAATVAAPAADERVPLTVADLALTPTRVQGHVLLPDGTGVLGSTVRVLGSGEEAVVGADGAYLLNALEIGTRTLRLTTAGPNRQPTKPVTLAKAGDLGTVDFTVPAPAPH